MRRFTPLILPGWRYLALPLVVWVVLTLGGAAAVSWMVNAGHRELEHRFRLRVVIAADFVGTYVADLMDREKAQAIQFLSASVVDEPTFARSVAAFGYPAAVLLDSGGRLLQVYPPNPVQIGQDLTQRYEHLRTALRENRPAVSAVVASAGTGQPVIGLAVPYETPSGRRVFSGALEVGTSPLGGYLPHAIALTGSNVYLVDGGGVVVGTNRSMAGLPRLADHERDLAAALDRDGRGWYGEGAAGWWYDSEAVPGTPWRLVANVPLATLYEPFREAELWSVGSFSAATLFGLGGVWFAGRASRNRSELRDSEERFRGLFDNSLVGMLLSDPRSGRLLRVNQAFCDMVGYPAAELLANRWQDLTHPDDVAASRALTVEAMAGRRRGFALDKRYLHADGHAVPVSLTCTLIVDGRGRPRHFATQIIDISERHRLAAEQQQAQQRTADLVAMLSHDVRQPLGVIGGFCELLLESWDDTEDRHKRRDVVRIAQAGTSMMQLVEEILTLSELDNADLRPRRTPIVLVRAVEQAVSGLYLGPHSGVRTEVPEAVTVQADPRHLQQILVNLLSNARKYGGDGEVVVTAYPDGDAVEVCVADLGEGVPPEFVPQLFERYTRADSGVAPTRSGTGLGLYIARQLVEANGGDLRYRRNLPRGSTFVVRLPAAAAVPIKAEISG